MALVWKGLKTQFTQDATRPSPELDTIRPTPELDTTRPSPELDMTVPVPVPVQNLTLPTDANTSQSGEESLVVSAAAPVQVAARVAALSREVGHEAVPAATRCNQTQKSVILCVPKPCQISQLGQNF